MKKSNQNSQRKSNNGFSLIEVLVSVVILSFGLLGMVGMQAAALQANRDARLQSAGVRLAREAAELIRDNKDVGLKQATIDNPYLLTFASPSALPSAAPENCFSIKCTTVKNIAEYGVKEWLVRVNQELPGARVSICRDTTPYNSAGVPQWACSNSGNLIVVKLGWTRGSTNRTPTTTTADLFVKATIPSIVMPVTPGAGI